MLAMPPPLTAWFTACLALAAPQSSGAGTIRGRVLFKGDAPPVFKPIDFRSADSFCQEHHAKAASPPKREYFVVNPNGTVRDVLAYIRSGLAKREWPVPTEPVTIDQSGCVYAPHVAALRVGQELTVRNSDPTLHNVHTRPRVNTPFNVAQPRGGMTTTRRFAAAELGIPLRCDVHPWMEAWIHVLDHPFYAITGTDGVFEIRDVPPGEYELGFWQERAPEVSCRVRVSADQVAQADVTLEYRAPAGRE